MGENGKGSGGEMKDVLDKLTALDDLQNLVQLDILNLKNEIEKIKLTSSQSPISPEIEDNIVRLEKLAKDADMFSRWKQTISEVKFLRDKLMGAPATTEAKAVSAVNQDEMDEIKRSVELLRKEMRAGKGGAPPINLADLKAAIEENRNAVEKLKQMITSTPRKAVPDIDSVRRMVSENRKLIDDLKLKIENSRFEFPVETHINIDGLHKEVTKLEEEVRKLKDEKRPLRPGSKDDMDHLRRELFTKLDDLNVKFGPRSSEEVKRALEANRASIEKLKALISGEETSIEGVKSEINENRAFMAEIKKMLLSKGPQKKIIVPPDTETRKRLSQIEQRMELLGRRLEKMTELRPIEIPKFAPAAAKGKAVASGEAESLRKEIDTLLSRMDGFLTKDDVEKGFLEKRLKADEKLMTGDIYKELNEIRKAIVRNEDHVTSVASDVERVKKEIGTVEKREWGKVSEIPAIDELRRKIEELEKKVDNMHEGPVFIE